MNIARVIYKSQRTCSFSVWLLSLSRVILKSSILIHVWIGRHFFLLTHVLLYGCTTACLSIHMWYTFGWFPVPGYYKSSCYEYLCTSIWVIFSNKWLGTEWLDHVIAICFIITDIARLFCKVVVSFYIFAISVCVLYSSTSLPTFGVVSLLHFCPFCTVCSDILLWF